MQRQLSQPHLPPDLWPDADGGHSSAPPPPRTPAPAGRRPEYRRDRAGVRFQRHRLLSATLQASGRHHAARLPPPLFPSPHQHTLIAISTSETRENEDNR